MINRLLAEEECGRAIFTMDMKVGYYECPSEQVFPPVGNQV